MHIVRSLYVLIKQLINKLSRVERQYVSFPSSARPPSLDENIQNNDWDDNFSPTVYRFVRALLGLPEQFEFKTDTKDKKFIVQFESTDGIERYKSPLLFKVIDNIIYAFFQRDITDILDKSFNITFFVKQKSGKNWVQQGSSINLYRSLKTPNSADLIISQFEDFLRGYFNTRNYE